MLLGSKLQEINFYLLKNGSQKSLLDKFKSEVSSDTSDCRSPRYDGTSWFIPDTSLSENSQSKSGEDPEKTPTTSKVQKPLEVNSRKSTSGIDDMSPNIPTDNATESTRKWKNFYTDNSKLTSSGSVSTVPFFGTFAHPITASSSQSSQFIPTPSGSNEAEAGKNEEQDPHGTIIVTSTPVKDNPPPLKTSVIETNSRHLINLPSEIFGSPSSNEETQIEETPEEEASYLNKGMNTSPPSSISSPNSSDNELGAALIDMKRAVSHSQNVRKRKFFETAIQG